MQGAHTWLAAGLADAEVAAAKQASTGQAVSSAAKRGNVRRKAAIVESIASSSQQTIEARQRVLRVPGRRGWRVASSLRVPTAALGISALLLSGCGSFFAKSTTPTTSTTTTPTTGAGDYLYIANANPNLDTVAGYSLASGALTATASSPYQLAVVPSAIAITPSNSFVYVGSELGGIYGYTVGSTGALTLIGSSVVSSTGASAMAVDATGKYLLVMQIGTTNPTLSSFPINTSTGALSNAVNTITLDTGTPESLLQVPNSTLFYASLGPSGQNVDGGVDALTLDSSTGTLTKLNVHLAPSGTAYSDNGLATDAAGKFLFVSETGINGVRGFTINTDGTLTELSTSPTSAGAGTGALLVDSTGAYLYAANRVDNTISVFSLSATGALTEISGSPFPTGSAPFQMVEDNSKGYLAVVCPGGTPDLQLFAITASTGALTSAVSQSTGTSSPAVATGVVASH